MLHRHLIACVIAFVLLGYAPLQAEAPSEPSFTPADMDTLRDMSLLQLMIVHVVTSASKYPQTSLEAPASVDVITDEDIKRHGYRNVAEALSSLPGVYLMTDDNLYYFIGIRGYSRPGDYSTRIAVLVDGHRSNKDTNGGMALGTSFKVDMNLIKSIEFVRGSSSSLYGQGALFGVINVITKDAEDFAGTEISTEIDVDPDRYQGNITFGKSFENDIKLLLSASVSDKPGQTLYFPEYDNTPLTNGVLNKRDYQEIQRLFAKLNYRDFTLTAVYTEREAGSPPNYGVLFDSPSHGQNLRFSVAADYRHQFNEQLETHFRVNWNRITLKMESYYDYGFAIVTNRIDDPSNWLNAEWQWQWHGERHHLIGGIEYHHSLLQEQRSYDEDPYFEWVNAQTDEGYWAVYLQDEFKLTDQLVLNA